MSRRTVRRRNTVVRLLLAIVVVTMVLGLILAGTSSRAQDLPAGPLHGSPAGTNGVPGIDFDPPSATGTLTTPLTFSTTFRSSETPDRVELLSRLAGTTTDLVRQVDVTPQADGSYTANLVQVDRFRRRVGPNAVKLPRHVPRPRTVRLLAMDLKGILIAFGQELQRPQLARGQEQRLMILNSCQFTGLGAEPLPRGRQRRFDVGRCRVDGRAAEAVVR